MRLAVPGALPAFDNNVPLVTSSRTLSAIAYQQFARAQLNAGSASWLRPEIYTFDAWLTSLWQEARYSRPALLTLLAPAQEHFLWQTIISEHSPELFDSSAIARLARQAADVIEEYRIPVDHEAWQEQQDATQFQTWYRSFRERCENRGWMARREILRGLRPSRLPVFVGFEKAPGPGKLLPTAISDRKIRLPLQECESLAAEVELAARGARARFEATPAQSIAVFVPELRTHRSLIERLFRSAFYPARAVRFESSSAESVFHINAPSPLTDQPLIANALLLLELTRSRMAQSDATAILRSPFLTAAAEERALRAKADLQLRRSRELEVSLRDVETASRDCPRLQHVWKRVRAVLDRRKASTEFARWARFFADLLNAVGWPGEMELSADEQAIVEMWKDALSSLSGLGMVSDSVGFETALGQLKRLVAIGGPETGDWLSPVQILDASDAPGVSFDAAFLVGLGDETWPALDPISPLVPLRLQRAFGVPEADPVQLRRAGLKATHALVHTAPTIAGSYTGRLAPQVQACARVGRFDAEVWNGKLPLQSFASALLEEYREAHGPAFDLTQEARGGTSIIKAQSQCPFRAFASRRLGARLPEDASFGFDALDRGSFVHAALQNVWQVLKTQQTLKATSYEDLKALIHDSVDRAVGEAHGSEFYSQASRVERERLEELLYEWLATVERDRTPFTVESAEQELHFELGSLPLRVRMDRIDRLANGGLVLIDYKTGANITKNRLKGDRPAEPQLLVYAAAKGSQVEGLLFGSVVPRDSRWNGITRSKLVSRTTVEVCKDWDAFLRESRENVKKLANEYVTGFAVITPSKTACAYCDLPALCRKEEQALTAEDAE
jgi:probable DNA repair protein